MRDFAELCVNERKSLFKINIPDVDIIVL